MKKGLRLASFPLKFMRKGPFMRNDDFQDACPRGESLAILSSEMSGDPDSEEGCSWLRALVAFANTQGGSLCVGMDSRTRMAKPLSQEEADRVQLLAWRLLSERSEPVLRPRIEAIPIASKGEIGYLVEICVEKSKRPPVVIRERGSSAIYIRRAGRNVLASGEEIRFLVQNSGQAAYDSLFTEEVYDPSEFRRLRKEYAKSHNGEEFSVRDLISMGFLSPDGHLSRGALLFRDGESDPRTLLVCTHYPGFDKGSDLFLATRARKGCLLDVIEAALSFVRERSASGFRKTEDGQVDAFSYPPMAVREALAHAFCQRNYYLQGRQVEVNVYRDRLEIVSPGSLPDCPDASGERDLGRVPPGKRNKVLAKMLSALGMMEGEESGFPRMESAYRDADFRHRPFFGNDGFSFALTLPDLEYAPGLLSDRESPAIVVRPAPKGARSVPVLSFCFLRERNIGEIANHLGLSSASHLRSRILRPLVEEGYLLRRSAAGKYLYRTNPAKVTLE